MMSFGEWASACRRPGLSLTGAATRNDRYRVGPGNDGSVEGVIDLRYRPGHVWQIDPAVPPLDQCHALVRASGGEWRRCRRGVRVVDVWCWQHGGPVTGHPSEPAPEWRHGVCPVCFETRSASGACACEG